MPGRAKLKATQATPNASPKQPPPTRRSLGALWAGLALAIATFALYSPSLRNEFVYDAKIQLQDQPFIHQHEHLLEVITFRVMARDVLDYNRPIHLASSMIDSILWGRKPFGYHLTSILLHTLNVVLLFELLRRWMKQYLQARGKQDIETGAILAAVLGAAVFAAHPLCTEVVSEPSYREDSLACFFLLIALLLATRWDARFSGRHLLVALGIAFCTLLSLGSKEIGVAVVIMLGLYWLVMRREGPGRPGNKPWALLIGACAVVTVAFLAARFALQPERSLAFPVPPTYHGGSFSSAIELQPRVWLLYLHRLFWPTGLCADYTPSSIDHLSTLDAVVGVGVFVLLQAVGAWKNRLLLLSAALFWLTLLPVSNFVPIYRHIADRFMYAPMLGIACAIAGMIAWGWSNRLGTKLLAAVVSTWIICLGAIAYQRQFVFSNSFLLWHDTAAKNPQSWIAAANLGWLYFDAGDNESAIEHFSRTNELTDGRLPSAWVGLALTLERLNDPALAEKALQQAINLEPNFAKPEVLIGSQLTEPQAKAVRRIVDRMKR